MTYLSDRPTLVFDPVNNRPVYLARGRSARPVVSGEGCPFCPGGVEVPEVFGTWAFDNRWPPIEPGCCEVLVHSPCHEADFASMSVAEAACVIDLWAERSARLARKPGVRTVLVFENRLAAAGATVQHPHSQIFGLSFVPSLLDVPEGYVQSRCVDCRPSEPTLLVSESRSWRVAVPSAPPAPYSARITPIDHAADLADLDRRERIGLAAALTDTVRRMDKLFGEPMPYQLWIHQSEVDAAVDRRTHLAVMVCGLLVRAGRPRVLGAAELATGMIFTPIAPEDSALALRAAM